MDIVPTPLRSVNAVVRALGNDPAHVRPLHSVKRYGKFASNEKVPLP
jgi:hypothetical protein